MLIYEYILDKYTTLGPERHKLMCTFNCLLNKWHFRNSSGSSGSGCYRCYSCMMVFFVMYVAEL